jgi:hypothetical protein
MVEQPKGFELAIVHVDTTTLIDVYCTDSSEHVLSWTVSVANAQLFHQPSIPSPHAARHILDDIGITPNGTGKLGLIRDSSARCAQQRAGSSAGKRAHGRWERTPALMGCEQHNDLGVVAHK